MSRGGRVAKLDGTPADLDRCPACGASRDDVVEKGYLGCPACYSAFRVAVRRSIAQREV
jgi:protein-arginine kinase activator protein McsA